MGLICIYLMIINVEHIFMCMSAICVSFLENCLFKFFPHLPLCTNLNCVPYVLVYVFFFSLIPKYLIFSYLKTCCLISTILQIFQFSFSYWFLTLSHSSQRKYFVWCLSFKIYWDLICGLTYGLSWKMSHVYLRMCILLGKVFYICLLDLVSLLYWWSPLLLNYLLPSCFIYYSEW